MGTLSEEVRTEVLCGRICDLEAENEKLRVLVRELLACASDTCGRCRELFGECEHIGEITELGIKADR